MNKSEKKKGGGSVMRKKTKPWNVKNQGANRNSAE
jgi:hypothetical protein